MDSDTTQPVLAFIPSGCYNSITHRTKFLNFLQDRFGDDNNFKLRREYSYDKVLILLEKYNFENVVVFNFDDLATKYRFKKELIKVSLKKSISISEINSGLSTMDNGKPDFNSISYFLFRGDYDRKNAIKYLRKLSKKISLIP